MELLRFFLGGPKILFFAAFILLFVLGLALISIFLSPQQSTNTPQVVTTPTPLPGKLTTTEETFPTAVPQTFFNETASQTGTLVIESNVPDVRVLIDSGEGEAPEISIENPLQITPFRIENIPVGSHNFFAGKENYTFQEEVFEIRSGEVTRIEVVLIPLN